MTLRVVTPPDPATLWVALADLKTQLGVDGTESDDFITGLALAAQNYVEGQTQRRFITQTLEWVRPDWCSGMTLPVAGPSSPDKISIGSVKYVDTSGQQQTLDPATMYWARPRGATLAIVAQWFAVWPWLGDGAERVVIRFTITGTPTDCPANIKHAVKFLVSHWFRNRDAVVGVENRDSSTPIPLGVEDLIAPERWSA